MGVGHQAGFEALARMIRNQQRRMNERLQRRRDRAAEKRHEHAVQPVAADLPAEDLVCPRCHRHFDFGADCPHCDRALVTASLDGLVPAELPNPDGDPLRILLTSAALAVAAFALLLGLFWLLDLRNPW